MNVLNITLQLNFRYKVSGMVQLYGIFRDMQGQKGSTIFLSLSLFLSLVFSTPLSMTLSQYWGCIVGLFTQWHPLPPFGQLLLLTDLHTDCIFMTQLSTASPADFTQKENTTLLSLSLSAKYVISYIWNMYIPGQFHSVLVNHRMCTSAPESTSMNQALRYVYRLCVYHVCLPFDF